MARRRESDHHSELSDPPAFGAAVRRLFQLEDGSRYLNHGSYRPPPTAVTAAQQRWQERLEADPTRLMERTSRTGVPLPADQLVGRHGCDGGPVAAAVAKDESK